MGARAVCAHRAMRAAMLAGALLVPACGGGIFAPEYEYEEQLYLSLDGSATLYVNASVAALVALRGADLDHDPRARIDRDRVRAMFEGSGTDVALSLSRRDRRRFVHVRVTVDDVRQLPRLAPFSWSAYRFERQGDAFEFEQTVGPPSGRPLDNTGWRGDELVAFRLHAPSRILYHNAPSGEIARGNILEWEQPLADRIAGAPLGLQVRLEPESILSTTLVLFGSTVAAVALTFALVVWWIARHGRERDLAESRS